jgi:hypothetical protein|tara:strand:- start:851 stop:1078 length:228 start_codon:yes stop_codon:yes gene_type:complete
MSTTELAIRKIIDNWTKIMSKPGHQEEFLIWCLEKCNSKFYNRGELWFFADSKDAMMFQLKFSDKIAMNFGIEEN